MKNSVMFIEDVVLILIGGTILFSVGFFSPVDAAVELTGFAGVLIGGLIYIRVSNRSTNNGQPKILHSFGVTLLMSAWASLCLLTVCNVFSNLLRCTGHRFNGFIMIYFFFPIIFVLIGWFSNYYHNSR